MKRNVMNTLGKLLLTGLLAFTAMDALAGVTQGNDPKANTPQDSSDGCGCKTSKGMPVYSFKSLLAGLNINDTPIGYTPPLGPEVYTTVTYNQREANQPAVFDTFNVGQKWTLNWLSWIQDDPASPGNQVLRYVAGGGGWDYSGYNAATGAFAPEPDNGAVLVLTSRSPVTYELRFADGRKDIFATADGAASFPRKVLLTEIVDAQGNALTLNYDSQRRLATITDAIGQLTAFAYGDSTNPLLVTGITDPYGRHATLSYDSQQRLVSITDVIGMTSTFAYDGGTFIKAMTTPYGTTTFAHTEGANGNSTELSIQATDPDGHTERTEYLPSAPGVPFSVAQAPSGMNTFNAYLNYRDSYYWDKDGFAAACSVSGGNTSCDYTKARLKHFEHVNPCCYYTSRVLANVKYPLEDMIWYDYTGQAAPYYPGTLNMPSNVGRVLSDGSTQITHYTYNAYGLVTQKADPDGRVTVSTYAPNGIDLLQVQQKVATGFDTLASYTYNSQHEPLTSTDAAGATTTYTYNERGQPLSVTNPLGETTRYQYDSNGYLKAVINALGNTDHSFTYDANGHIATDTDAQGYTRQYQYDALDRIVAIVYPDSTSSHFAWNRLDLTSKTDRQGNTSRFDYDAERNLVAITDPLGRVTRYGYYPNGTRHTMTDPSGNVTTWTRDLEGRVTAKTYADGSGTTSTFDNSSRLAGLTDALGQTTAFSYDRADLLTGIQYAHAVYPTAPVAYAYDPYYPRLVSMSDELGTTQFSYVLAGQPGALRQSAETGPFSANDTVHYGYDALGRIIQRTTDVETDYTYDPLGRLSQEHNPLGAFQHDYLGDTDQLTERSLITPSGNPGLALTAKYDSNLGDRQLRRLTYRAGKHRLTAKLTYTHSPEHLLTSAMTLAPSMSGPGMHDADEGEADTQGTHDGDRGVELDDQDDHDHNEGHDGGGRGDYQRYGYDEAYHLTDVWGKKRDAIRFDYDAADNMLQAAGASSSFTATANALNQLATVNGQAWQYDADGQLLNDGTRQYAWDAAGRLIGLIDIVSGKVTTYRYDGLGRRLEISSQGNGATPTDTRYLWCGTTVCQARDGNDVVTADYFDQGETHGAAALYYVRDQLGSVSGVTDVVGKVLGTTRYGAYGTVEAARGVQPDFGYAGMLRDPDTALSLTMFRAYDPTVGRWLSRDPIGERGGENLYAYAAGDPVDNNDPSGLIVKVVASDPAIAHTLMNAYAYLNAHSPTARSFNADLENSSTVYKIEPTSDMKNDEYCPSDDTLGCEGHANTVFVDACDFPLIPTTAGMQPITLPVLIGHELGHAWGYRDNTTATDRLGDNVRMVENPIRQELGLPLRTRY
jgi:RHS repeat-associated protein